MAVGEEGRDAPLVVDRLRLGDESAGGDHGVGAGAGAGYVVVGETAVQ